MDSRNTEYLQLLQERNRLKKQLQAKSKQELELEAKERGFSVNIYGANADRTTESSKRSVPLVVHTNSAGKGTAFGAAPLSQPSTISTEPRSRKSERISPKSTSPININSSPRSGEAGDSAQKKERPKSYAGSRSKGWASKPPDALFGVPIAKKEDSSVSPTSNDIPEEVSIVKNKAFSSALDGMLRRSLNISDTKEAPKKAATSSTKGNPSEPIMPPQKIEANDSDEAYAEDFEALSDEEWTESVSVWKSDERNKLDSWLALKSTISPTDSNSAVKDEATELPTDRVGSNRSSKALSITRSKSLFDNPDQVMASSVESDSSTSSRKINTILDKTYQSSNLANPPTHRSPGKKSIRRSKNLSNIKTEDTLQNPAMENVDLDQSLIRKLMSLDPQQKAVILSALQGNPSTRTDEALTESKIAPVSTAVIYEDEVALNIRIKIMSTWTRSKFGSLSCLLLRPISDEKDFTSDIMKTPKAGGQAAVNYLSDLTVKVVSGGDYMPQSAEAVRLVNQLIITTKPSQKMFPTDAKMIWKAPISSEKPLELSFQGHICIRSDQSVVPMTETTTADELFDGLELILVNGWGPLSCKDIDVYVGYRCIWSGVLPDTSKYTSDRFAAIRLPSLLSDAIASETVWTKKIVGIGKKNFIQRRKSISDSPALVEAQETAKITETTLPGQHIGQPLDLPELRSQLDNEQEAGNISKPIDSSTPIWLEKSSTAKNSSPNVDISKKMTISSSRKVRDSKDTSDSDGNPVWLSDSISRPNATELLNEKPIEVSTSASRRQMRLRSYQDQNESHSLEKPPLGSKVSNRASNSSSTPKTTTTNLMDSSILPMKVLQDPKVQENHLRASLEALSIADRRNLGRINARSNKDNESNIESEGISSHSELKDKPNENEEDLSKTGIYAANVIHRRARRIQEVNKTVQNTVQGLAHVFSNTHIVLNPSRQASLRSQPSIQSSPITVSDSEGNSDNDSMKTVGVSVASSIQSAPSPTQFLQQHKTSNTATTLPKGRVLVLEIYSTWGDEYYVGLNGLDIFDSHGRVICPEAIDFSSKQVAVSPVKVLSILANPPDINILPDYDNDPRVASNLLDGVNFTKNDLHLWLAPVGYYKPTKRDQQSSNGRMKIATISITFSVDTSLSMIRIFNYNKSRTHTQRGIRECKLLLNDISIYEG